jgi:hypothetical protein
MDPDPGGPKTCGSGGSGFGFKQILIGSVDPDQDAGPKNRKTLVKKNVLFRTVVYSIHSGVELGNIAKASVPVVIF